MRIRRKDATVYTPRAEQPTQRSPFDVAGIQTLVTTADIVAAVRESRAR